MKMFSLFVSKDGHPCNYGSSKIIPENSSRLFNLFLVSKQQNNLGPAFFAPVCNISKHDMNSLFETLQNQSCIRNPLKHIRWSVLRKSLTVFAKCSI